MAGHVSHIQQPTLVYDLAHNDSKATIDHWLERPTGILEDL